MATAKSATGPAKAGSSGTNTPTTATTVTPSANDEARAAWVAGLTFPVDVTLRNNGPVATAEPATCAFLAAGGQQVVTLHDETLATLLVQNLAELNATLHGSQALLVIDGVNPEVLLKGD